MKKSIFILFALLMLVAGITIGGFLFSDTVRRPFLNISACHENCIKSNELLGFLASVGIQAMPGNLPKVIFETDKTLVFDIQYPYPPEKIHYAIVPKKDIKDIGQMTEEDKEYFNDAYSVIGKIVNENNYKKYRVSTNGPGFQEVTYLHFHLVIDREQE